MVPNGSAYSNFPPFATNGTKTPPGGSPESAKYALGMVPADTFPAEWANYLFHGATAGITRLNADTGSIKKEINSVLDNFNITPDGTLTDQLMTALNKLKAEAALAAHPVGSLYWTSSSENPAVTFGGGTWVQIKDRFVYAKGDSDTVNATGGAKMVTLSEENIPRHNHDVTNSTNASADLTTHSNSGHSHIMSDYILGVNNGTAFTVSTYTAATLAPQGVSPEYTHTHKITLKSYGGDSSGNTVGFSIMPPYICKYCWERTA